MNNKIKYLSFCIYSKAFIAVLCLNFLCLKAEAQQYSRDSGFIIKRYTQQDGMAGTGGYTMLRDNHGFLWIGGNYGLSRFDGRSFVNFSGKDGFEQNSISDLRTDTTGILYAASSTRICLYTGSAYRPFRTCHLPRELVRITNIYPVDSNYIYLADDGEQQLYLLRNHKLEKVQGYNGHSIQIEMDHQGLLYVLTSENRIFAVKGTTVVNIANEPPFTAATGQVQMHRRLEKDRDGNVFFSAMQLWQLDGNSRQLLNDCRTSPCNNVHYNFSILSNTRGCLYVWNNGCWMPEMGFPTSINYANTLLSEKNGNFWMLFGRGLFHYYPQDYQTRIYQPIFYYLTTDGSGQRIMQHDSLLYKNADARRAYEQMKANRHIPYTIYHQHNGTIWYCTNAGVYYLTGGRGPLHFYNLPHLGDAPGGIVFAKALEDREGSMWFETYSGAFRYKDGQFHYWAQHSGLEDSPIYSCVIDGRGTFLAGCYSLYAWTNDRPHLISDRMGIDRQMIHALSADKKGDVWVCLNKSTLIKTGPDARGIYVAKDSISLNINGKEFIAIAMAIDGNNNLWLASYGQIVIYLHQPDNHFSNSAKLVLGKDQQLIPLTDKGRLYLYPDASREHMYLYQDSLVSVFDVREIIKTHSPDPPQIQLTDIRLNDKPIDWLTLGYTLNRDGIPVNAVFTNEDNTIHFQFTGIAPREPDAVVYQYKLEGLDKQWHPVSSVAEADFTNLSPGNYIFRVKAADINGLWSVPASFPFTILPPWYRTWWAWILWALCTAGCVWWLFTLRVKAVKRRAGIERLVVEQQLKALRAQINPHFLQNTFDFLSQTLDEQPLQRSQQVIRQLSAYMRNVLYRSDETVVTMEDELDFADEYLAINQLLFYNRFHYEISIGNEVDTFGVKLPSMLLQPMLENAIKHGVRHTGDGSASINILVKSDDEFVTCIISNSIPAKAAAPYAEGYRPKGLQITEQRMALLFRNAAYPPTITVKTEDGFYRVIIRIPL